MHKIVGREDVHRLMREGAQVVEVLPLDEYEEEHLPGAISIPLKTLHEKTASILRKDHPIVVYCHDLQ
jgi:phage shock protein E